MPENEEEQHVIQGDMAETTRLIMHSALDAIICIDLNGGITVWNPQAEKIFGWTFEEVKGKQLTETIIPVPYRSRHQEGMQHYLRTGVGQVLNRVIEITALNRSGKEFPIELTVIPIWQDGHRFFCAFLRDITERKNAEAQQQRHALELERKNKELEHFAYMASHDLQEPLRTTASFVELLRQQYQGKLDEHADKYITFIVEATERMKTLIDDLLSYSRIGRNTSRTPVDTNTILREVLADLQNAIGENNAVIRANNLPVLPGVPTELKSLFQNLISNSIKFRKKEEAPQISITAVKEHQEWKFSVQDNGIGIEPHQQEKIFILFQRLHSRSQYEGTGIGLAHCRKIVELHGGRIWVESEPGTGSTFYFTIQEN